MRKKAIELTTTWNKDLEIGATLEGVYLKKETVDGNYGQTIKYIIESIEVIKPTPVASLRGRVVNEIIPSKAYLKSFPNDHFVSPLNLFSAV